MNQVVIVGSGLVGSALALGLIRGGLTGVVLVDAQDPRVLIQPHLDGRRLALSYQTYSFFKDLGLIDAMGPMEPLWHIQITDHHTSTPLCFHAHDVGDHPMGFMVDLYRVRQALSNALNQTEVQWSTSVTPRNIQEMPYGWQVRSDHGVIAEGALLVGADGRHSWVRTWTGVKTWEKDYHQTAIVFNVTHDQPHDGWAFEHFLPSGPFAVLPGLDSEAGQPSSSVVWTEKTEYAWTFMGLNDAEFNCEINRRFSDLGPLALCSSRWSYPLKLIGPRALVGHRWVLVGDAAHTLHPIAGQGFNLGIQDIQVLIDRLSGQNRLGLDVGSGPLLKAYQRTRYPRGMLMAAVTHGVNHLFSSPSRGLHRCRQAGMGLLSRLPSVQHHLMRYAMGLN